MEAMWSYLVGDDLEEALGNIKMALKWVNKEKKSFRPPGARGAGRGDGTTNKSTLGRTQLRYGRHRKGDTGA